MAMVEQKHLVDALTRVWNREAAKRYIESHLRDSKEYKGDVLFLIHLEQWEVIKKNYGIEASGSILRQFAFLLEKVSKKADFIARIGEETFLAFGLGCNSQEDAAERISTFFSYLKETRFLDDLSLETCTYIGAVLCHGEEQSYDRLLCKGEQALEIALDSPENYWVLQGQENVEVPDHPSRIRKVPLFRVKDAVADMEFITRFTDALFRSQDSRLSVEMALEGLCRYFNVEHAYVLEQSEDKKYFRINYEYDLADRRVANENLKDIPSLLVHGYEDLFDEGGIFVCNRIEELQRDNPYMAERQKLRGTRSLMQSAILEDQVFIGYIGVSGQREERLWSEKEITTFSIASRILAANVLQNRYQRYTSRMAYKDLLTEAWNLKRFLIEAEKRLDAPGHQAVLTFDLKDFKVINIEFGYVEGNMVLMEISNMLRLFIEDDECYARIEADRFVLLLRFRDISGLQRRIERLLSHIERLSAKLRMDFPFICMAGICLMEDENDAVQEMIERANGARKTIKDFHKSNYAFYNKVVEMRHNREKYYASHMKAALENREFIVYYQPKVEIISGKYVGLEALVRWRQADGQMIQPDEFIPLFERNGFIVEVDLYVFEQVCQVIQRWTLSGKVICPIAVNLSRIHILEPDFLEQMVALCRSYQVSPGDIELELTESAFLDNPGVLAGVAREIKQKGFKLSMDDFGTGYSSLSMLKDITVDILKLDRGFFKKSMSRREKIIISNVIRMAKELEIEVISEGIETIEHQQFLKEIGCNLAQGYLYAKPGPLEEFEEKIGREPDESGECT